MSKFEALCVKFEAICAKKGWEGRLVRVRGTYHDHTVFKVVYNDKECTTGIYDHIREKYLPGLIDIEKTQIAARVLKMFERGFDYGENTN